MKYTTSLLFPLAGLALAVRDCTTSDQKDRNEGGNSFCGAVDQIVYSHFIRNGSFQAVTDMSSGCQFKEETFEGPLATFDKDLSLHFRGPLHLKEVAVYNLASKTKRDDQPHQAEAGSSLRSPGGSHGHGHRLLHRSQRRKRAMIKATATIDGKVVSFEFPEVAPPTPNPSPKNSLDAQKQQQAIPKKPSDAAEPQIKAKVKTEGKPESKQHVPSGSAWDRVAYYNAEKQSAEGLVFMGNYGNPESWDLDRVYGSSLSYLSSTGDGRSAQPEVLSDRVIPSNKEFSIFSDNECKDGSCGYVRPGTPAYKGFAGGNKIFLFHFKMPSDKAAAPGGFNVDMPAIWSLNARIPRTGQYTECSCWKSGCGEFDIFEVLAPGDNKAKSTVHLSNQVGSGGSSDYFLRPTEKFIKLAMVFHAESGKVSIKIIPDSTDFAKGLDDATVMSWIGGDSGDGAVKALGAKYSTFELNPPSQF